MSLRIGIGVVLAAALLVAPAAQAARDSALEADLLGAVNDVRAGHGLAPLRASVGLAVAADRHSRAMARYGFFAHESRDGSAFWRRIERSYASFHFDFWAVGENLVWSTELDAAQAVDMWLASPPHRKNLLDRRWREVGFAAVRAASAPGIYGGQDVTIVTADFGVRR